MNRHYPGFLPLKAKIRDCPGRQYHYFPMKHEEPFKISVNNQHVFDIQPEQARQLDMVCNLDGSFHILHEGRSWHAEPVSENSENREYVFRINGEKYTVRIDDLYDRLIQQLGLQVGAGQKSNQVKAPMPGLVLSVSVEAGQTVAKGDPLLILEAMKMENVIKAAAEGTVKAVHVLKGAAVDKGQLLVEFA